MSWACVEELGVLLHNNALTFFKTIGGEGCKMEKELGASSSQSSLASLCAPMNEANKKSRGKKASAGKHPCLHANSFALEPFSATYTIKFT